MNRMDCSMQEYIGNDIYCGYYDAMYKTCSGIKYGFCPDGCDDEDDDDYNCDNCCDEGCFECKGY